MEWRVNVECALLVKSISNFLHYNWWLQYITNKQTLITNSSLPRKESTEDTDSVAWTMLRKRETSHVNWVWSCGLDQLVQKQSGYRKHCPSWEADVLSCSWNSLHFIELSSSLPHSEEPPTVQILSKITHFHPLFKVHWHITLAPKPESQWGRLLFTLFLHSYTINTT